MTPISRASLAPTLSESRTARSAQSPLRPCGPRRGPRRNAAASFVAFADSIAPERPTGCAAPTFVAGAIAATGQASRMKVPADAARAPLGET